MIAIENLQYRIHFSSWNYRKDIIHISTKNKHVKIQCIQAVRFEVIHYDVGEDGGEWGNSIGLPKILI